MARFCSQHTVLTKANFEWKIPGQSGKLGGTPRPRPKNETYGYPTYPYLSRLLDLPVQLN